MVHRLPAGIELFALVVTRGGSVLVQTPAQAAALLVCVLLGYAVARVSVSSPWRSVRPVLWVLVPLCTSSSSSGVFRRTARRRCPAAADEMGDALAVRGLGD